jgi:predicted dehydrogenase
MDEAMLAGLCDNRPDRLDHARAQYEGVFGYKIPTYADYREMCEKAGLDAVMVSGPNYLHRDMTLAALDRGLHVLCEKPMELTLARCDEMIAAAAKAKRVLALGMQMHYRVRYHKVRELIAQGVIGTPAMAWCTEYRCPFAETKDWVWEKEKSGGAIVEKNCHHYDILNLWLQSEPTTVYATGNIVKHTRRSGKNSQIIDNAWIVNDFADGARAMVGICFLAQGEHYREFGVQGTEGRIFFSSSDDEIIHVTLNNGGRMSLNYTGEPELRLRGGSFKDFVHCARTGEAPLVSGTMGRKSLLVPLAAERSIAERRVVQVSELQ